MELLDSSIFDLSPIAMWLEDFSEVKKQFDLWRAQGIQDLEQFLLEDEARVLLEQAINQRVDELAREKFFMTYKELAKYLNLSKPTIEELLINNGMKYYMVGSTYRFKKSDVDEFMEKITSHMDIHNNDLKQINVKKLLSTK